MKETCEYRHKCAQSMCPPYKKACLFYCQSLVKEVIYCVSKTSVKIDPNLVEKAPSLAKVDSYYTTSLEKVVYSLLKELQRSIRKVKIYNYVTAIDASIGDEIPQEQLVYIDSTTKFKEADKGRQAIESFVRKLVEANKTVLVRVQPGYPMPEGQRLL